MSVGRAFLPAAIVLGVLVAARPGGGALDGPSPVAAAWIGGLALALVARWLVRRHAPLGVLVVRALMIAAAALTVPSFAALAELAAADPAPGAALARFFVTVRLAPLFVDVNAAGSVFGCFAVAALWLALAPRGARVWMIPGAMLTLATWLTGSRSALAAAVVALAGAVLFAARPSKRAAAAVLAASVATVTFFVFAPPMRVPQASSSYAWSVRRDMARVAVAMTAAHPMFGVGIGRFQRESSRFIPPGLVARFPPAAHGENAHNTFLQVLAELGGVGLLAFTALLVGPLRAGWRALGTAGASAEAAALFVGLVVFLLTGLTGHPLVTPAVTLMFFLALGVLDGMAGRANG